MWRLSRSGTRPEPRLYETATGGLRTAVRLHADVVALAHRRETRASGPRSVRTLAASTALCFGAAALLLLGHRLASGLVALVAGGALVAGTVAARRDGDGRSAMVEAVADRLFDGCLLASIAWVWRSSSDRVSILALVCLSAAYLASYERARGESLRYRGREGIGYRATRVALLSAGLLTGAVEPALWLFASLAVAAAAVRAWNVARQERLS